MSVVWDEVEVSGYTTGLDADIGGVVWESVGSFEQMLAGQTPSYAPVATAEASGSQPEGGGGGIGFLPYLVAAGSTVLGETLRRRQEKAQQKRERAQHAMQMERLQRQAELDAARGGNRSLMGDKGKLAMIAGGFVVGGYLLTRL